MLKKKLVLVTGDGKNVYSCSQLKDGVKRWNNGALFQVSPSSKAFKAATSVLHKKNYRSSCVKNLKKKENLSPRHS